MADRPSSISGIFRRPFREQVAFFRGKLGRLVPTRRWDDLDRSAHDTAFMVAGAQKADLLADLAAAVDRSIAEGQSLDAFRKDFAAAVERHDWHGWTGEGTKGGRAWRTRTIYRTNTYAAYAAGRFAQLKEGKFALWVYKHGGSEEPRPEHLSWDGVALPPDHPFWTTHYPPSDWGCSCYVAGARSAAGVRRLGGDPEKKLPDGWDAVDAKTGAPVGIGKGWDYAPGASVAPQVQAIVAKASGWQYQIAKAFMESVPVEVSDQLAVAYRRLPSVADDARRYAARVLRGKEAADGVRRTLGPLTSVSAAEIGPWFEKDLSRYDWSIAVQSVLHVHAKHGPDAKEHLRGQRAVTPDDFALLPRIIADADRILRIEDSDSGEGQIELTLIIGGELYTATFVVFEGRRTLTLKTLHIRAKPKARSGYETRPQS